MNNYRKFQFRMYKKHNRQNLQSSADYLFFTYISYLIKQHPRCSHHMHQETQRHQDAKFPLLRLMMEKKHSQNRSYRTTQCCHQEKASFRNTPFVAAGFPFINAICQKRNYIYKQKIDHFPVPFMDKLIRFFFRSTPSTRTSTTSPTLTASSGCLINFSLISEM